MPGAEPPAIRVNLAPGPSQVLPGLAEAAQDFLARGLAGLNHRSPEFTGLMERLDAGLHAYLGLPADYRLYFVSSATWAMELALRNLVRHRVSALAAGAFGERFAQVAALLGRDCAVTRLKTGWGWEGWRRATGRAPADLWESPEWGGAEAWLLCHNETAAGTVLALEALPPATDASPLRLVDCVSSAGAQRLPWERADLWLFGVQKAFGCPPGLAVMAAGPRARTRAAALQAEGRDTGAWFSFARLEDNARRHQTPVTPNTLGLALLEAAVAWLRREGLAAHEGRCRARRDSCLAWLESHPVLCPAVAEGADRSLTVTALARRDGGPLTAAAALRARGVVVGGGYGEWRGTTLRLSHFPAHTEAMQAEALAAIDACL